MDDDALWTNTLDQLDAYKAMLTTAEAERDEARRQLKAEQDAHMRLTKRLCAALGSFEGCWDNAVVAALERAAKSDVCEVCGDCLLPDPPRCESHAHTERGDDEWPDDDDEEEKEATEHCVLCSRPLSQWEAAQVAGACAGCVAQELT